MKRGKLKRSRHRREPPGTPPGSLISDPHAGPPQLSLHGYSSDKVENRHDCTVDDIVEIKATYPALWLDVTGLADVDLIARLGEMFGLHRLSLEDVVEVHQRPKAEIHPDHIFVVLRMLTPNPGDAAETINEQISIFVGKDYVLTFQERRADVLDPVRKRLEHPAGRLRQSGCDYLGYAILDTIIDGYFPVLERYGDDLERLEDRMVWSPDARDVRHLHSVKRDLTELRRAIWPTREMLNALVRDEATLISPQTKVYLRDVYDHAVQLIDLIETYREIASGLVDLYLSSMSTKMNEVMKVLTIIATIFIPLSFLVGLWGMNFEPSPWNMPELRWDYGYPAALALMAAIAAGMLFYFWRKGWLSDDDGA